MSELADAIRELSAEKKISIDLVASMVEEFIKAAYKRKYGTDDNCVVELNEDQSDVVVYARKMVVDEDHYYNEATEIPLDEALLINPEAEAGDEINIFIDPKTLDRISVQSGKQRLHQKSRDVQKNTIYNEFKSKEGEMIIGYYQRVDERTGDIIIDLGNGVEGRLYKKFQNPTEMYRKDDKIKCYVAEVREGERNVDIILSRTHSEFVRKLLEIEVPEISDGSIQIYKIVREAGYRTKVAVYTNRTDIDPVGACVGLKGIRIQAIMAEMNGEKIDILRFDNNPEVFLKNALSPAQVQTVRITDPDKRIAVAVVDDSQLSFAIGKSGLNVRLANKLTDWMIEVKTPEQYEELDLDRDIKDSAEQLFSYDEDEVPEEAEAQEDGELLFASMPLSDDIQKKISGKGIESVEQFVNTGIEDAQSYFGFTEEEYASFKEILSDYVELVDEDNDEQVSYVCPSCGAVITPDMTKCPECGCELEFEEDEEEK